MPIEMITGSFLALAAISAERMRSDAVAKRPPAPRRESKSPKSAVKRTNAARPPSPQGQLIFGDL